MTTSVPDLGRNELYEEAIPYELFARLRQESPLWIEEPAAPGFKGGPGYWAVLRHADVQIVSRHPEIYSSWLGGTELRERPPQVLEILRQQMLNTDPPQHSKMRRIVSRAFTPQVISQLRASIEAHVDEVIDAVADNLEHRLRDIAHFGAAEPRRIGFGMARHGLNVGVAQDRPVTWTALEAGPRRLLDP